MPSTPVARDSWHESFDDLSARSAVRAMWVAGGVVGLPALIVPDAAWYYAGQAGSLMAGAALLTATRRRLSSRHVAQAVLALGTCNVAAAAWLTGGAMSPAFHAYAVALVGACWLVLSARWALLASAGVAAAGAGLAVASVQGWTPAPWVDHSPWTAWLTTSGACLVMSLVQHLEVHRLRGVNLQLSTALTRSAAARSDAAEHAQRYADVVSTVPGVVYEFEVRPQGTRAFTFMSAGARQLFECAPDAIMADPDLLFGLVTDPGERQRLEASITASYTALSPWEMEGTIHTPSGASKWVRAQSLPTRLADGGVRWHGVITDMTERIKAEHALRASQQALKQSLSLLQSAFDSTADGLLVVDLAGHVTAYNQKFLALWRLPDALAQTQDEARMLAHATAQLEHPQAFLDGVRAHYDDPTVVSFDALSFKDGRRYERFSQPQVVDGQIVGRVWSFRDVTARLDEARRHAELEQALQQAHTLEALGALAGGIAHDFNNLLTIIWGNAEQIAMAPTEADRQASLEAIVTAAERAGGLVRQIHEFSQPRTTERTAVVAAEAVGTALQLLRSTMPKSIELAATLDPSVTMFANATQVHQVVTNLVVNAGQAIGDRAGRIHVTLDRRDGDEVPVTTPHPRAARYARLTVTDTGRGIPADALPRLFEPFYTTRAGGGGSGLGLAVVNGIVRRCHGTVTVESTPGTGTTFRVFWPALPPTQAPAPAPLAATGPALAGAGRRLLVVDDEAPITRVLGEGLRRLGYDVETATDPRLALELFLADPGRFDAVLSDLSMPHLTGAQLGRRMLDVRPDLPILIFTGYAAELSPDEVRTAGFRAVLAKPLPLHVLAEALHRVLAPESPA